MSQFETEFKLDFTLHVQKCDLPSYAKASAAFQQTVNNYPLKIQFRMQRPGIFVLKTYSEADCKKLENKSVTFYYGPKQEKQVRVDLVKMPKFQFYANAKWITFDWLDEGNLRYVKNSQLDEFCKEYGEIISNFEEEKNEFGMLNGRRKGRVNLTKGKNIERIKWVNFDVELEDGTTQNARGKLKIFYQGQPVYCKRCAQDHENRCPQLIKEEALLKDYDEKRKQSINSLIVSDSEFRSVNEKALFAHTNVSSGAKIGHIANVLNHSETESYKNLILCTGLNNLDLNVTTNYDKWHTQLKKECKNLEDGLKKCVNQGTNIRLLALSEFPITKSTTKAVLMSKTINKELKGVVENVNKVKADKDDLAKLIEVECKGGDESFIDNKHFTEHQTAIILEKIDESLPLDHKMINRVRPKGLNLTTGTIYSKVNSTYRFGCTRCTLLGHNLNDCKLVLESENSTLKQKRNDRLSSTETLEPKKNKVEN